MFVVSFPPRLFETLQSLFWSVFGLINLYVTNVKARHEFTEFVGATMFGTYNVISLVVLLNMLIAMMNNSYQLIAVSSWVCFSLALKVNPCPGINIPAVWRQTMNAHQARGDGTLSIAGATMCYLSPS